MRYRHSGRFFPNAEVELIDVTTRALLNIGFTGFTVNINDRRILRGMLESMGFSADTLDSVCITFDKMDKIGADGVKAELTESSCRKMPSTHWPTSLPQAKSRWMPWLPAAQTPPLPTTSGMSPATNARLRSLIVQAYCPSLVRGQG